MKLLSLGADLFHADGRKGWTDGHTWQI